MGNKVLVDEEALNDILTKSKEIFESHVAQEEKISELELKIANYENVDPNIDKEMQEFVQKIKMHRALADSKSTRKIIDEIE